MKGYHGIIFAYGANPDLRELVSARTASSMPFCGRYRLVDFALSSLHNTGITNVGVILQRDYQSLLDHIGSGKSWDMSRRSGGLRMLPPFGLPEYHRGEYVGTIEALNAVSSYIKDIREDKIVLMLGNLCANIDIRKAIDTFESSGADITAVVSPSYNPEHLHHCCVLGEDGFVSGMKYDRCGKGEGVTSLETYVIKKQILVDMMDYCAANSLYRFHQDALKHYFTEGLKMSYVVHDGYAEVIKSVDEYYRASMDMLRSEVRRDVFTSARPIRTKSTARVSTFYSDCAKVKNSLVADGCIIEGELENCIVFSGAHIEKGARLKNCIIFRAGIVGKDCCLTNVIADKRVIFSEGTVLTGNDRLPVVVPKGAKI